MADQKKNSPPSEDNRPKCFNCRRIVSKINRYLVMLDNEDLKEQIKRKRAKYFGCGATGSCETENASARCWVVPKTEKECGDLSADNKMLQAEGSKKLLSREDKRKVLEEMETKYPLMVAIKSEADEKGNFAGGFDIFCLECEAFFNDVELAQQHFEQNLHDNK